MKLIVCENYEEMSEKAAEIIKEQVVKKSDSVLGFATGSTPVGTYDKLAEMYKKGELDMSGVTSFNLDEYYPISNDSDQSYHCFMERQLFGRVNIAKDKINMLSGEAEDPSEECERYEKRIEEAGGIDLQILGIGRNGHIGFNEPDTDLEAKTHLTELSSDTIEANSRFFENVNLVPTHALTMGISTIFKSKKIILLANGRSKLNAIRELFSEHITTKSPATMLKLHPDVTIICDYEAYSEASIGIDIGGMSVKIGVVENLKIIDKRIIDVTSGMTEKDLIAAITSVCAEMRKRYKANRIGIGVPGIIDENGVTSANLPFKDCKLDEIMSRALDVTVKMENDANCAALGEQVAGAGKGVRNMLMVTLGTGIGGGIIIDGKIYSGKGNAGEIGHMRIMPDGKLCKCGKHGCWERYASVSALIEMMERAAAEHLDSILADAAKDSINGKTLFKAMDMGCDTAKHVFDEYIGYLAAGIDILVSVLDPELILIAGGISRENEKIIKPLSERIGGAVPIKVAELKSDAGIIGAALL